MKMIVPRFIAALGIVALLLAIGAPAFAYRGQRVPIEFKIGIDQARRIALKAHPGKITEEKLWEAGGNGLRYIFIIKQGPIKHEVSLDAASGRVLENKAEGPNPD